MMSVKMSVISLKNCLCLWQLTLLLSICASLIAAECNICQVNQVACVNSSSYHLCFGASKPNTDVLYHCKDGFDCTNLNAICVQTSNSRPPSCGDTSQCGLCSAHRNYLFACTSRKTFQMCYGALRPSGQIGNCPENYVCDANSDAICVNSAEEHSITCDVVLGDDPPTSSETPTTTEDNSNKPEFPLTPIEVCEQMRQVGLFPTMPHDPFCKRYIYCYYNNGIIKGIEYTCSAGSYYEMEREQCTLNKPAYCI